MKNISALLFFIALSVSFVAAQKVKVIHLETAITPTLLKTDFYIDAVEDHRSGPSNIGIVKNALETRSRSAVLGESLTEEIKKFLSTILIKDENKRPLKLLVHQIWVSEKRMNAYLEMTIELQELQDSAYVSLGFYEQSRMLKGIDSNKRHARNIRNGLKSCMKNYITGMPSLGNSKKGDQLSFVDGIPFDLKKGFYRGYKKLNTNAFVEIENFPEVRTVNKLVKRYLMMDSKGEVIDEYAYFSGKKLLINSYVIGTGGNHYLEPATSGRYLVLVDKYGRSEAALAFGLMGAAASTKTRANVLDTETGIYFECNEKNMKALLSEDYKDLYTGYKRTMKKPEDQISIIQELNEKIQKENELKE